MPPWGRPSGALAGDVAAATNRRRYGAWGPRSRQFRELGNNSDEDDGQGVILDPANFMSRDGVVGDELYFTGYDLDWARDVRHDANGLSEDTVAYGEEYDYRDDGEPYYYQEQRRHAAYQRHGDLVGSANEKLRRAKEKGKTTVSLSPEEVEALQRTQALPRQRESTPPKTPSKGRSGRSNSLASQGGKRSSKKSANSRFFSNPSPSTSRTRTPKSSRKSSLTDQQINAPIPPPFIGAGPSGTPMHASPGYQSPPPEALRPASSRSRAGSRSASSNSRREETPPFDNPAYVPYRFYNSSGELRPAPSSTRMPVDDGLRIPRTRSASNAPQYSAEYFAVPSMPANQGRRGFSGPADMQYSNVRRGAPLQGSPLVPRPAAAGSAAQWWPPRTEGGSGLGVAGASPSTSSSSSSSDDEEEGVRVEILPEPQGSGYRIERKPVGSGQGSELKRRKGRK